MAIGSVKLQLVTSGRCTVTSKDAKGSARRSKYLEVLFG